MPIAELFRRFRSPKATTPSKEIAPNPSFIIEPATGEKKVELELACAEYLQNPDKNTAGDFANFAANMIRLIGGEKWEKENRNVIISSNRLVDQETQTFIFFKTEKLYFCSIVHSHITAKSTYEKGGLNAFFRDGRPEDAQEYSMYTNLPKTHPELNSYIAGKKELVSTGKGSNQLNPTEAKDFARRVFAVWQRQGQNSTPTPV